MKNFTNNILTTYYQKEMFRKLEWYSFINKQKSESNMMNRFEDKFGSPDKVLVLIGDYSENRPKKYQEPTKGKSIRRLFKNRGYKLHLVNEFRTSIRLIGSGEKLEKIRWDNKRNAEVHRLLGSKILSRKDMNEQYSLTRDLMKDTNYRPTIINRDLNASLNIRLKGLSVIMGLETPYYLERTYDPNPENENVIDPKDIIIQKIIIPLNEMSKESKIQKISNPKKVKVVKTRKPKMVRVKRNVNLKTQG